MSEGHAPPIATATVARLYMEQGKLDQAEGLYRRLLRDRPDDERLKAGLAEVQRRREGQLDQSGSGDRVTLELDPAGAVRCRWHITEEGQASARLVLGESGRLVLRVVAFPIRPNSTPADTDLDAPTGEATVEPPRGASLVGAAVGLLGSDGGFVSITHCPPLSIPA